MYFSLAQRESLVLMLVVVRATFRPWNRKFWCSSSRSTSYLSRSLAPHSTTSPSTSPSIHSYHMLFPLIVGFLALTFFFERLLDLRQHWRFSDTEVPALLRPYIDPADFVKAQNYGLARRYYSSIIHSYAVTIAARGSDPHAHVSYIYIYICSCRYLEARSRSCTRASCSCTCS